MKTPTPRLSGELVFSLVMVLLAAFLLWSAYSISGFSSITSAGSFPMAASALMLVCGLIATLRTAQAPRATSSGGETLAQQFFRQVLPPVAIKTTLLILLYMLTLESVGFLVGSFLFLALAMHVLGSKRWGLNLLVSACVLGAIYVIFQTAFSVQLPMGTVWQGVFP